jgi:hypothetical protein
VRVRDTAPRSVRLHLAPTANAIGTEPALFDMINLSWSAGTSSRRAVRPRRAVCVLGNTRRAQLFPYQDPIGRRSQSAAAVHVVSC